MKSLLHFVLTVAIAGRIEAQLIANLEFHDVTPGSASYSTNAIVDAADYQLWFTSQTFGTVGTLDVETGEVDMFSTRTPEYPDLLPAAGANALALDGSGHPWYAAVAMPLGASRSVLVHADPITRTVEVFPIPTPNACQRGLGCHITLGPDGRMWFTEPAVGKAGAITTDGEITEYELRGPGGGAPVALSGITTGPDNALWLINGSTGKSMFRLTTSGQSTEFRPFATGTFKDLTAIAAHPNGRLYVTEAGTHGNKVAELTTEGVLLREVELPTPNSGPVAITVGADQNLYIAAFRSKEIIQFNPDSGEIRASPVPNGEAPTDVQGFDILDEIMLAMAALDEAFHAGVQQVIVRTDEVPKPLLTVTKTVVGVAAREDPLDSTSRPVVRSDTSVEFEISVSNIGLAPTTGRWSIRDFNTLEFSVCAMPDPTGFTEKVLEGETVLSPAADSPFFVLQVNQTVKLRVKCLFTESGPVRNTAEVSGGGSITTSDREDVLVLQPRELERLSEVNRRTTSGRRP